MLYASKNVEVSEKKNDGRNGIIRWKYNNKRLKGVYRICWLLLRVSPMAVATET